MLFLMMKPGEKYTQKLVTDVKNAIRKGLSARHVPKYVFETPDIPVSVHILLFLWRQQGGVLTRLRQLSI